MTKTITTNKGETLTLTKLGKARISRGWRRFERVIYKADDGSFWARYNTQWNELGVATYDGNLHFRCDWLRFAN